MAWRYVEVGSVGTVCCDHVRFEVFRLVNMRYGIVWFVTPSRPSPLTLSVRAEYIQGDSGGICNTLGNDNV
jgi:hypothetical protein